MDEYGDQISTAAVITVQSVVPSTSIQAASVTEIDIEARVYFGPRRIQISAGERIGESSAVPGIGKGAIWKIMPDGSCSCRAEHCTVCGASQRPPSRMDGNCGTAVER